MSGVLTGLCLYILLHMHAYFYFFKSTHNNLSMYFTLLNMHNENMHNENTQVRKAGKRIASLPGGRKRVNVVPEQSSHRYYDSNSTNPEAAVDQRMILDII